MGKNIYFATVGSLGDSSGKRKAGGETALDSTLSVKAISVRESWFVSEGSSSLHAYNSQIAGVLRVQVVGAECQV